MATQASKLAHTETMVWPEPSGVHVLQRLRRYFWPGLILVGAVALLLANLTRPNGAVGHPVRLSEVSRGRLSVEVLATGAVQPRDRVELHYTDESAEVETVLVEPGDAVTEGQPLIRLAATPLLEEVRRAQSQCLEASYRLADAKSGRRELKVRLLELAVERGESEIRHQEDRFAQEKELAQAGLISKRDKAQAEHELSRARLAFQEAKLELETIRKSRTDEEDASLEAELRYRRAALERAETALARSVLRSPAAGKLLEILVRRGNVLRRGDLAAVIADVRRFRVSAMVDEMQVGRLRLGEQVWIRGEFFGDSELQGTLERIIPSVRKERGVPSVEILVDVPQGTLEPPAGLTVDVGVRIQQSGDVTRVPLEAVVERQGQSVVFVYESGRARQQPITVGLRNDTAVEVLSGVAPGQRVVTAGHTFLLDGESVTPIAGGSSGSLQVEFFK